MKSFQTLEEKHHYLPTQHFYEPISFETHAYFSFDWDTSQKDGKSDVSGSTSMLESMVKHYNEMERLIIRNYVVTPEVEGQDNFKEKNSVQ